MRRAAIVLLALSILGWTADKPRKKGKPEKPPEIRVIDLEIRREAGLVAIEGKVRNGSDKPFKGLVLFFEFLEPGGKTISRMNSRITESMVEPGDDGEFQTQTPDQVRAVHVRLDAEDRDGRYLTIDKPGPYTIE
jgi:hypothetical protein